MTVLVTGSSGFLGGLIVETLLAQGRPVRGLDLTAARRSSLESVTGSILDPDALAHACRAATGIIHAAAIADLWHPDRTAFDRVNAEGTARVLAKAEAAAIPMVLVSSYTTLIGTMTPRSTRLTESNAHPPEALLGPYPASKRRAELVIEAAAARGHHVSTVLPTAPFGARDPSRTPPTRLLADLAAGRLPAILDTAIDLVDARAVAAATVAALDRADPGARYLLAGTSLALPDLARRIAAMTGVPAPRLHVPGWVALGAARAEAAISALTGRAPAAPLTGVRLALANCQFDASHARRALGFAPRALDACLTDALAALD